jgi:hypothetical protein
MRLGAALRWAALGLGLFAGPACRSGGDLSLGLSGCDSLPSAEFPRTPENTVPEGFRGGLTRAGIEFLTAHRELIAHLIFEVDDQGFVHLPLPDLNFGGAYSLATRDVVLTFDLRSVDFEVVPLPDPARLRVAVREARVAVESGVLSALLDVPGAHGDAACYLGNGIDVGTREAGVAHVDVSFDLQLGVNDLGGVRADVTDFGFTLHDFGFTLSEDMSLAECDDGAPDQECRYLCSLVEAGGDVLGNIYDLFQSQLDDLLRPALQDLIDSVLQQLGDQPLAVVGRLHLHLLASLLPSLADAWPFDFLLAPSAGGLVVQAGTGGGADGAELTLDVGLRSGEHPCVPRLAGAAEPAFQAVPPPALTGLGVDGLPYHLGFSVSDAVVNRATWVGYRAGALCLVLDPKTLGSIPGVPNLDSSLLDLALPGLTALTRGPRPFMLVVEPGFQAADFDLIRFREVVRAPGDVLPRVGLDVHLPHLGLSFYVMIEERWVRVFSVRTDVDLGLEVQTPTPTQLALAAAQPQIGTLELLYDEPVAGQNLDVMVELLLSLAQSSLLTEGLAFDLPFAGLIEQLTGLRIDVGIVDLSTAGGRHLTAGLRLADTLGGPQPLRAEVDTRATLVEQTPETAVVAVEAPGTARPLYQWRFAGGPWSPLLTADAGRLALKAGRLWADAAQVVEIRAVDAADPHAAPDPSPAQVALTSARTALERPAADSPPAAGCQSGPGRGGPASALLLALVGLMRGRRRRAVALVGAAAGVLGLAACGENAKAERTPCTDTAECPGGLVCLDNFCEPVPHCATSEDCCPASECRQGVCLPAGVQCTADADCAAPERVCLDGLCQQRACAGAADCPQGVACVGGYCHPGPPCGGRCVSNQVCFADLDVCAPVDCAACPPGEVKLAANPEDFRGPACPLDEATCACVTAPPVNSNDIGRHASMAIRRGEAVFAAWDADYGDLVLVEGVERGELRKTWLDGIPEQGEVQGDPAGPRRGITTPGPDRGRYSSLTVDNKGRLVAAYYDANEGDLRYLRDDGAGNFIAPVVVDAPGDVGRFARVRTDGRSRVHIVAHAPRMADGQTGLRYSVSLTGDPQGPADFFTETIESVAPSLPSTPLVGDPADGTGIAPCLAIGPDDRAYVAFYNSQTRRLTLAVQAAAGFALYSLSGTLAPALAEDPSERYVRFAEHDVGRYCDLIVRPDSTVALVFTDADTQSLLLYEGPVEGGGTLSLVDAGTPGLRGFLGADPALALDVLGEPVVAYQDQTQNDLRWTRRSGGVFLPGRSVATPGALGFYNGLAIVADKVVLGTVEMRATATGRSALSFHVFRLDPPAN